ncbi:Cytochrome c oxidase subunit 5B, mitochondrial [Trachymyrmex septentrionalis]|uniref:Cytochrome c oxidase subunit 5B, mitochondrial n=1 Tax=Trachymyrmex septentrionalis TaxID=34720 RepID=A0A195FUU0_9HYME|nr:PREDICTED: cytochrome c oxidase subunit 5B, mitochondrial-like isoform X1 [Trachymyrmex septentrionalis]KYN44057.1 Cytochrome c oxidase subunit 5B, mitochondrial [Trachymyrmex septentrionalis]
MAWLCARTVLQTCRRRISYSLACSQKKQELADPLDHATGLEKREMLAYLAGNDDPYNLSIKKRAISTKEDPNIVYSAFESRIMGCICDEDSLHVNWMWLHQGPPRRCECGHWFKLVEKAPI